MSSRAFAAIHASRRQVAGLDDDEAWRDFLEATTGKRSLRAMTEGEVARVLDELRNRGAKRPPRKKQGRRAGEAGDVERKIRALWISLWHLGVIEDRSDKALAAFVKRQAGVDDPRWLNADQAPAVIEALKDWATREAGVDWSPFQVFAGRDVINRDHPRARVIEAQWRLLNDLGVVHRRDHSALCSYVELVTGAGRQMNLLNLEPAAADLVIRTFGGKIRRARTDRPAGGGQAEAR